MRVPFTAPQLPELDALPVDQRTLVLERYARSADARRFIRFVQVSILAAVILFCIALTFHGAVRAICCLAAASSLVGGVAYYRMAATKAIRTILHTTDSDLEDDDNTPKP